MPRDRTIRAKNYVYECLSVGECVCGYTYARVCTKTCASVRTVVRPGRRERAARTSVKCVFKCRLRPNTPREHVLYTGKGQSPRPTSHLRARETPFARQRPRRQRRVHAVTSRTLASLLEVRDATTSPIRTVPTRPVHMIRCFYKFRLFFRFGNFRSDCSDGSVFLPYVTVQHIL